jgi:hypothetical protein
VSERVHVTVLDAARPGGVAEGVPDRPKWALLVEFPPPLPAQHRGRVDQHDPPDDRVAGQPDPGQRARPQRGDRVRCVPGDVLALLGNAGADLLQDRPEQRLLAREMVVERAAADPGAGLHHLDRRAVVAMLGEQPRRDLDHVRPGSPAPLDVLIHPLPGAHRAPPRIIRPKSIDRPTVGL